YTSAPKTALIIATIPVVVLVLSALMLGERSGMVNIAGIILSFGGIVLLVVGDPEFEWNLKGSLLGDLLIGGAVLSASLYMIFARDLSRSHSSFEITFVQIVYGAVFFCVPFAWELPSLAWSAITPRSMLAVVYLTVFATVGAFLCYNFALSRVAVSRAAVFVNGIPVVTAIGAWALLDERLTTLQAGGGTLVLTAVFITNLPTQRFRKKRS
ncbi:MAG: DMT family transporter, partial [Desulfosarcina sp.]